MKSNKRIGTEFEKEFCKMLADDGWWVHFIEPSPSGGQPFDVIAVKDGKARAFDCKTCVAKSFSINRLEDNQIMAFLRWELCGNATPCIAVKHEKTVYILEWCQLKTEHIIKLDNVSTYDEWREAEYHRWNLR